MEQPCVRIPTRIQVDGLMLRIRQILGIGAFVVIYKAVDEEEPWQIYALKEVLCLNASQFHNAVREVQILKQLSHENVISLIGVDHLHDGQGLHMLILTEFCVGGNLNERLHRPSSDETNETWIREIPSAVAYLHSHDIFHLDLKADNVLLTATGDIKLADFGLAREFIPVKQFVMEYGVDGSGMMSYSKLHRFKGWLATLGGSRIFPPSVQQESRCFFAWHFNFRNPCARFYHI